MADLKVPPHNKEAEEAVLGGLLIDKEAIVVVAELLRPEHFYDEVNGIIYSAILSLYEERKPIDLLTLTEKLRKKRAFKKIGGAEYLTKLAESVPTAANIGEYGQMIRDSYTKRTLISTASKISELGFSEGSDVKEILDKVEQDVFAISQSHLKRGFVMVKEALAESFDRLDALSKKAGSLRGVSTGFSSLDNMLAGMQESNLLILAARPGIGKTAFSLNLARHATVVDKIPVGFFSLEMSKEELVDRLLVAQADIDSWKLKTGRLSDEDFVKLSEAMGILAEAPLYIDDTPALTVMEMRTKARRLQIEVGLQFLIVDYLQLADCGRRFDSRVQEVSMISQSLKNLARELKIPVLAVSQLSRAVEARGTKVPQLADLRESGAIEQDADVVMFLYRPEIEEDEETGGLKKDTELIKLLIAKHRNGPLGEIDFMFKGSRISFFESERKREKKG